MCASGQRVRKTSKTRAEAVTAGAGSCCVAMWGDSPILFPRALVCGAEQFGLGRLDFPGSTSFVTDLGPSVLPLSWSLRLRPVPSSFRQMSSVLQRQVFSTSLQKSQDPHFLGVLLMS